jgi:hypothetical protein
MEHMSESRNRQQLEEFLQDLFFQTKSDEELNLLVEILLEMRSFSARTVRKEDQRAFSADRVASRSEIFKISVQDSVRQMNKR